MALKKVAETTQIAPGQAIAVSAEGRDLALFNVDGTLYCLENECPHVFAPLSDGWLNGEVVTCAWHAWQINVTTGEVVFNPLITVPTYPCTVQEGAVYIEV